MLSFFRKHSQSFMMWMLVGAIGFIFIVQFGPQSRGCRNQGEGGGPAYVAKVRGATVSDDAFRWAWIVSRAASVPREESKALRLKESVVSGLVERELLAQAAEKMGLRVTGDEVDRAILGGSIYYNASVHSPVKMPSGPIPIDFTKDDGSFDVESFKMMVGGQFQMTLPGFTQQQERELLAYKMRTIIENGVRLFPAEAREEYEKYGSWVKVETAAFDPADYAADDDVTDAAVAEWAKANDAAIRTRYKDNESDYTNAEKKVRVRSILVRVADPGDDEEKEARQKAAAAIADRIARGEDFAALARELSEDDETKKAGGDHGYRPKGYFEEKLEDVVFGMKEGEVKGPIETGRGFEIVTCEGFREGTIPLEEVRLELARALLLEERGGAAAKADAARLLALLDGGKAFDAAVAEVRAPAAPAKGAKGAGAVTKAPADGEPAAGPVENRKPEVFPSREIGRKDTHVTGIGFAADIVEEVWGMDPAARHVPRVVEKNGAFFVVGIKERHEASAAEFQEHKDAIERALLGEKRLAMVEQWIDAERTKAEQEGAITINQAYLKYPDETAQTDEEE